MYKRVKFHWPRYWVPLDKEATRYGAFLHDPESEFGRVFSPDAKRLQELSDEPFLVLLGEPTAGKSTTVEDVISSVDPRADTVGISKKRVDARAASSVSELHRTLDDAVAEMNEGELFLDSIDESPLLNMAFALRSWITKRCPPRIRVRILCRTSALTPAFESELAAAAEEVGRTLAVWKLAPLRQQDVKEAALQLGFDASNFMKEIERVSAQPFAAMAGRLSAMALAYQTDGKLANDQWEMFEKEVRALCEQERDAVGPSHLRPKLDLLDSVDLLARIAAVSVFCGAAHIWTAADRDAPMGCLRIIDLADRSGEDPGDGVQADESEVCRVLGLAPLRPVEQIGAVSWGHRQTAEFLAARYLLARRVPIAQLRQLMIEGEIGRVHPQLHGVAAMLCSRKSEVLRLIAENNPHVALQADLASTSDEDRQFVAERLLALIELKEISYFEYSSYGLYQHLSNSSLAATISNLLRGSERNEEAREAAAAIARQCNLFELVPELLQVALDQKDRLRVRLEAVRAISEFGNDDARGALRALLEQTEPSDPDSDLKGCALEALWPTNLGTPELLARLTIPGSQGHLGYYRGFVDDLADRLPEDDISVAIEWLLGMAAEDRRGFRGLAEKLLGRAFRHIDRADVRKPLARLVLDLANSDLGWTDWPWERDHAADFAARRELANDILALSPKADWTVDFLAIGRHGLLNRDDFALLLDEAVGGGPRSGDALRLARLMLVFDSDNLQAILIRIGRNAAFDNQFSFVWKPIEIDSDQARDQKNSLDKAKGRRLKRTTKSSTTVDSPSPRVVMRELLAANEAGNRDAYWRMDFNLRMNEAGHEVHGETTGDLTRLPGWEESDEETRRRIVAAAKRYVSEGHDQPETWLGKAVYHRPDLAGYRAIRLLRKSGESLTREDYERWAAAIVTFPDHSGNDEHNQLVGEALIAASDRAQSALLTALDAEARSQGYVHFYQSVRSMLSGSLGDRVLEMSKDWDPLPYRRALDEIARSGNPRAMEQARSEFSKEKDLETAVSLALLIVRVGTSKDWPPIWTRIQMDAAFGDSFVQVLAEGWGYSDSLANGPFFHAVVKEELFGWLEARYPTANDTDPVGPDLAYAQHRIQDLRNGLLTSLSMEGNRESVAALDRLAAKHPDHAWMHRVVLRARMSLAEANWVWPTPVELRGMLQDPARLLVRTDSELLVAVRRSLEQLQKHLLETGMSWQLWDQCGDRWKPKIEERFSDFVSNWLNWDLQRIGVLCNREVVARIGERFDILVDVIDHTPNRVVHLRVIVEAKMAYNRREMWKAMKTQLVEKYMQNAGARRGLYLVGYTHCSEFPEPKRRGGRPLGKVEWNVALQKQAAELSNEHRVVEAYVMDIGLR